jgi:hypothetical protein
MFFWLRDLDPSINKQKMQKNLDFYYFVTPLGLFIYKTDLNVPSKGNICNLIYCSILSAIDEKTGSVPISHGFIKLVTYYYVESLGTAGRQ